MKKALVLSSGGIDSTTCLAIAIKELGVENVDAVTVYYGQKHSKEVMASEMVANHYGVRRHDLDLSKVGIFDASTCPLLEGRSEAIRHESYAEQIEHDGEGMVRTYVPFRNGLMLSAVAALAMSLYPDDEVAIVIGAHADDAAGNAYADCSVDFVKRMDEAISIGTYEKVRVWAPLVRLNKTQVVEIGLNLKAPYQYTWSCYEGGKKPCGTCGTCIDRQKAFEANGSTDPALDFDWERIELQPQREEREMQLNDYQKRAYFAVQEHESKKDEILNWIIGLNEEAGEVASILKHVYWGGEELNPERIAEELGDELWYLAAIATSFGLDLSDIAENNLAKLQKRHPDKEFSIENSINRHVGE